MDKHFKQLLYAISFFDVILNERKHYAHFGWNIDYEFGHSDFVESIRQLQHFLCDSKAVDFETLTYVIGECFYGARVVDAYDRRLLLTILARVFNQQVLDDPFYCLALNGDCALPRRFEHRMIVKHVEEAVSIESDCRLYGLHCNSNYMHKMSNTQNLLHSMRITSNVQAIVADAIEATEYLDEILGKLPSSVDLSGTDESELLYDGSMNAIFYTEIGKYNILLVTIRSTCHRLRQAIQGNFFETPTLNVQCSVGDRFQLSFSFRSNNL